MKHYTRIILIIIIFQKAIYSQSIQGTSGLINLPTARMLEDKKLVIGAAFIPKNIFQRYNRKFNPGLNTYVTYAILPYTEVMFRYTHELNTPIRPPTINQYGYFPDRMFSIRFRVLGETKVLPSIVFGFHDLSSILNKTVSAATNYNASYIVFSKKINLKLIHFDFSSGYAYKLGEFKNYEYAGFFIGSDVQFSKYKNLNFYFEYDSKYPNIGFNINLINKFVLRYGLINLSNPTISFNYILN